MLKAVLTVAFFIFTAQQLFCRYQQNTSFQQDYQLHISRAKGPITIDGDLGDSAWAFASNANDFWKKYPNDVGKAARKTEVKVLFDNNFLYFGFVCHDSGNVIIQSLKRDAGHDNNESVVIVLDPHEPKAGWFLVCAECVKRAERRPTALRRGGNIQLGQ